VGTAPSTILGSVASSTDGTCRMHPRAASERPALWRHEQAISVWAISDVINISDIRSWFADTMRRLSEAHQESGGRLPGPPGGLFFEESSSAMREAKHSVHPGFPQHSPTPEYPRPDPSPRRSRSN
jgi:hypothetical protein